MHSPSLDSRESRSSQSTPHSGLMWLGVAAVLILLWLIWNGGAVAAFKEEAGPVTFFASMALLPALGFPLTPFFVMAGATFGSRVGLVGSAIALSLNLGLCYWIARSGLRRTLLSILDRFDYQIPDFEQRSQGMLRFVVIVKMTPGLPGFVKNYVLGLVGVPFWTFFIASMAFTGLYAFALVVLGESLQQHELSHTLIIAAVIVVLAVAIWWWRRRNASARNEPSGI
jgi:uncharacterized membrane protein YdjX (TVP38/TMEM64 family)